MGVNVKGVWLNTASIAGLGAAPKMSIYAASKHAVLGLTRSATVEYRKKNVRINAVCPAALYLCSDAAGFTTGIALPVDGGATAL